MCVFTWTCAVCSGTFAVTSIMVGNVVQRVAPTSNFVVPGNNTNGTTIDTNAMNLYRLEVAMALTIVMGIYQVCVFVCIYSDKLKTNNCTEQPFEVLFS